MNSLAPTRPLLRWHGGKWRQAPRIIRYFPPHRRYLEVFGGAASILLRKPPCYAEIYNDLDQDVVGLFRIMRDPVQAERLIDLIRLTPFARDEFDAAYERADDPLEQARRLVIRSFMGFGSDGLRDSHKTGFRNDTRRSGTVPAHDWVNYPESLAAVIARLRGVVIENRDALQVIAKYDGDDLLIYADPPYLPETRRQNGNGKPSHGYNHELDRGGHEQLLAALLGVRAMVVLSGYASDLYDTALAGWHRVEIHAMADGARARREILWLNPSAHRALAADAPDSQRRLFEVRHD